MGSCNFADYYDGTDLQKTYDDAVQAANYEHGHDAYSGAINTTGGVRYETRTPMTLDQAHQLAEQKVENYSKWEACGAIPILDDSTAKKREVEVSVTVPGKVPGDGDDEYLKVRRFIEASARNQAKLKAGEFVAGVHYAVQEQPNARKWKVSAVAGKGKALTKYVVVTKRGEQVQSRTPWERAYPSQAAARAAAVAHAEKPARFDTETLTYEVESITRREDGSSLVTVTRQLVSTEYKAVVKLSTMPTEQKVKGFLFFGWAAM